VGSKLNRNLAVQTVRTDAKDTAMKVALLIVSALILVSCAATNHQDAHVQAIEDFIHVGELEAASEIRHYEQTHHEYLNDHFVFLTTRREQYLVKFVRRCIELRDNTRIKPDIRREAHVIRAKFDTIRGCRIESIYPVNEGQVEELKSLGNVPGSTL